MTKQNLSISAQRAMALYDHLKRKREFAAAAARPGGQQIFRRLRAATHVDLSKADPRCTRCAGTGRLRDEVVKDEKSGEVTRVPVVCICVMRGGGVKDDLLDRITAGQRGPDRTES